MPDIVKTVIIQQTERTSGVIERAEITLDTPAVNATNYWIEIMVPHTDLQAPSLTNDIEIFSLPAGGIILGASIKPSTQFAGPGILTYTGSIGIAGTLNKYALAFPLETAVSDTNFQLTQNFYMENWGTVTSVRLAAISTGANLDQSTGGEVCINLLIGQIRCV